MAFTTGTRIGPYEITSPLGEGGMGVVYRAHDTKLGRDVALKALPDAFANDADRLQRFQREAQVLASLNHPNIAQIYGLEESDKTRCIVMELVDGQTLQERLRRGPIPVEEALPMASQIATALEAAHERGIVHRDLKPANIKLTPDGKVKVLDFGLAKAFQEEHQPTLSNSPTLIGTSAPGVILGTAAYMSPEQARGKEADRSSDIWAFGCVLYEMLTGHAAFEGETIGEILGGVFKAEPDWSLLPAQTPEAIRRLLRHCLQKDRSHRLKSADALRIEIEDALSAPPVVSQPDETPIRNPRLAWAVAAVATLAFASIAVFYFRQKPMPEPHEIRLEITTPPTTDPASIAISPDGQKIVFVATSEGHSKLWVRPLDSASGRPLPGTDGASMPFWSPDGQLVGFFAEGRLKRVDVDRGSVQILADAPSGRGGAWNRDGTIIFVPNFANTAIFRILATGGTPSAVTRLGTNETNHRFPQFLPDGHHFLYYVQGGRESHGIHIGDLNGSPPKRLLDVDSAPVYASSGYILFASQGALFAQQFDADRSELKGSPFSIVERIAFGSSAQGWAAVSTSAAGPIVYRTELVSGGRQFIWFDRSGKEIGKAGDPMASQGVSISPDSRYVALHQPINNNFDIWLLDLGRGVPSRFTLDPAVDNFPTWSPDGRRIAFASNRKGPYDLYWKPVTGPATEELLLTTAQDKSPSDWSRDDQFLLYVNRDSKTGLDLWALPLGGDRKPFVVAQTTYDENGGQFSPDSKWVAYESNESGRYEIYVQAFPGPASKVPVSKNGGTQVRWQRDGKELFYIALDGRLMAVPIRLDSKAQTVDASTPIPLFVTRVGGPIAYPNHQQYDVSADGQRFLMNTIIEEALSPITIILNWKAKP
jgi:serine/threonine protein kinase